MSTDTLATNKTHVFSVTPLSVFAVGVCCLICTVQFGRSFLMLLFLFYRSRFFFFFILPHLIKIFINETIIKRTRQLYCELPATIRTSYTHWKLGVWGNIFGFLFISVLVADFNFPGLIIYYSHSFRQCILHFKIYGMQHLTRTRTHSRTQCSNQ